VRRIAPQAIRDDVTSAPRIERGGSKVFKNADEAVADIQNGSTVLSSGFGLCGVAGKQHISRRGPPSCQTSTDST